MKFIRDIIGEKRQLENTANSAPVEAPADSAEADQTVVEADAAPNSHVITQPEPQQEAATIADHAPAEADRNDTPVESGADDIAAFFAGEDQHAEDVADNIFEDVPNAPQPAMPFAVDVHHARPVPAPMGTYDAAPERNEIGQAADPAPAAEPQTDAVLEAFFQPAQEAAAEASAMAPQQAEDRSAEEAVTDAPLDLAHAAARPSAPPQMPQATPETEPAADMPRTVEVPRPAVGRGSSRHGRVKTRLLGFNTTQETGIDPISGNKQAVAAEHAKYPAGWLVVVDGAGHGSAFTLFGGVSTIGRGENQTVRLDFGDNSISRENHASIAYDPRQKGFFIGHGGKANLVRRNDRPVLSTEEMLAGDHITIGETTLRFVPFCGPDFTWEEPQETGRAYASGD